MVLRRMAHSMGMDEAKRDVVRKLPRELMSLVFSFLDLTTLWSVFPTPVSLCPNICSRCKRVSKEWLQILISDQAAWANIHLNRPRNPGRSFEKFLKYRPGIRSLIIEDVQDFGLSTNRVATLCGLRGLKRLHFGNAKKGYAFPSPGPKNMLALQLPHRLCELTHLSLRFTEARNFLITDLISVFRETLEDINVVSGSVHHLAAFSVNMPFPRLKRLRLAVHVEDICPIELVSGVSPPQPLILTVSGHSFLYMSKPRGALPERLYDQDQYPIHLSSRRVRSTHPLAQSPPTCLWSTYETQLSQGC